MQKMRLGMIGTGGRGGMYRQWMQDERVQVVAGADVSEASLRHFADDLPEAFVTKDYRRLLDRGDVDAVAVCTPDWLHREHAVAALRAGKHLFCEKPLAITIQDCDDILRAWQTAGVRMMVGFNMRYAFFCVKMKELVEAGTIGEVKTVWTRHFVGWGGRFYYHDWHASSRNTTGLLLQKATHDLDVMHWICKTHTVRTAGFGRLSYYGGDRPDGLRCDACDARQSCPEAADKWGARDDQCAFRKAVDVEDVSVVIALRETLDRPQFLATTRHVSMGAVSVKRQTWSDNTLTLELEGVPNTTEVYWVHRPQGWTLADVEADGAQVAEDDIQGEAIGLRVRFAAPAASVRTSWTKA